MSLTILTVISIDQGLRLKIDASVNRRKMLQHGFYLSPSTQRLHEKALHETRSATDALRKYRTTKEVKWPHLLPVGLSNPARRHGCWLIKTSIINRENNIFIKSPFQHLEVRAPVFNSRRRKRRESGKLIFGCEETDDRAVPIS
ncbi:hypothetical protein J6590_016345 [Homalodisca vitripennis]|nr:hypothetical protein J6590_016345 [Homalodisca vitripennis]